MSSIDYFLNSNSSKGFVSFLKSNTADLKNVINLSSYPSVAAESIIGAVIRRAESADISVEVIHNCLDLTVEGVVVPKLSLAVINCPVYYNDCFSVNRLENEPLLKKCKDVLNSAYEWFAKALEVHDKWEKIYIENTDFDALNDVTEKLCDKVLKTGTADKKSVMKDRFFGASTVNGPEDYVENITKSLKKRYFIKGRPGSGKSTMMKKIAAEAENRGFDVDVYRCAFDPDSVDMVVIKELETCVFDSTSPHEYFPSRDGDEVVDVYDLAINPATDIIYKHQLADIALQYKSNITVAVKYLNDVHKCCEKINKKYLDRLDYNELENVKSIIIKKCFGCGM